MRSAPHASGGAPGLRRARAERPRPARLQVVALWRHRRPLPPLHFEGEGEEEGEEEEEEGDDDEGEEDSGSEEEEGEEGAGWFAQWVGAPRVETVGLASYMCALLHQQALIRPASCTTALSAIVGNPSSYCRLLGVLCCRHMSASQHFLKIGAVFPCYLSSSTCIFGNKVCKQSVLLTKTCIVNTMEKCEKCCRQCSPRPGR